MESSRCKRIAVLASLLVTVLASCASATPLHAQAAPAKAAATAPTAKAAAVPAAKPPELVPFTSAEAQQRLERSHHKADFFALVNQFESQEHMGNCGPTSSVIVLNALRDSSFPGKPVDEALFPAEYRAGLPPSMTPVMPRYTQGTFFDARFEKVKPKARFFGAPAADGSRDPGLQLRQLHGILLEHGLSATLRVVDDAFDAAIVRRELLKNLETPGDYVLVSYTRAALGQPGAGHISPLAAYDAQSDSVLVLDVNPSRAPFVWVPMDALIAAMRTKDTVENRGYLLITEGAKPKTPTASRAPKRVQ